MVRQKVLLQKNWSLRHVVIVNVVSIALILFVGGILILRDIHRARVYNHQNIEMMRLSSAKVTDVVGQFTDLVNRQLPLRRLIARQEAVALQVKHEIVRYVIQDEDDPVHLQQVVEQLNQLQKEIESTWPGTMEREHLQRIASVVSIINDIGGELFEIRSPAQLAELAEDARSISAELVAVIGQVRTLLDEADDVVNQAILAASGAALAENQQTIANAEAMNRVVRGVSSKTMFTLGLVVILVVALQVFIFMLLRQRLQSSLEVIARLSKGDLTVRFDASTRDEIGLMLEGFNSFVATIQEMIRELVEDGNGLVLASRKLSAIARTLHIKAEAMLAQSETVAISSEEMTTNLSAMAYTAEEMSSGTVSVSSTVEQMSNNMTTIAGSVEEMSVSIANIAEHARDGAQVSESAMAMAGKTVTIMNTLGETANDIGKVTEVIKGIAEQTNLLALNAAIEAAVAGEAGLGFAVVANEIKVLATRSAVAAKDIASRIDGVQKNTEMAVAAIAEVSETISSISGSAAKIAESVEEQTRAANEISANVVQTSSGTTHVAVSITGLAQSIAEMSGNISDVADKTGNVSASIHEVSRDASESNQEALQVSESAASLSDLAGQLQKMLERFKVESEKG